jgi:hypothetical protein
MYVEPLGGNSSAQNDFLGEESYNVVTKINSEEFSNRLNRKIMGLALSKIPSSNYGIIYGHRVVASPQVILNILPKNFNIFEKKKKQDYFFKTIPIKEKKRLSEKYHSLKSEKKIESKVPIGIFSNAYNTWINALLQFIMFIPSLRMMFNYTPKSFSSFNDFIDVYLYDQETKKTVSNAPVQPVIETLSRYFCSGPYFENEVVDLFGILNGIMKYVFPLECVNFVDQKDGDLLALFPSWRSSIENENIDFEEFLSKNFVKHEQGNYILPLELLINFGWFLKKPVRNKNQCNPTTLLYLCDELFLTTHYELDSFIEFRPDEFRSPGYLTYVKIDGLWFQCDDSRIRQIRSNNLHIALSRCFIFHYKIIKFSKDIKKLV